MQIQGAHYVHGPHALQGPHRASSAAPAAPGGGSQPVDQLDISQEAQALSQARQSTDIRQDLVSRVKAEIAAGTYDTDEKFEIALDRLLNEIE
jgi:negative regulator of flagellin synthesis FlgM